MFHHSVRLAVLAVTLTMLVIGLIGGVIIGLHPAVTILLVGLIASLSVVLLARDERRDGRTGPQGTFSIVVRFGLVAIATFAVIQLVPYRRDHSNSVITSEPAWATPETRELMVRACFGCHSNEVKWPGWYSSVAPISWAVTRHVVEGRDEVNYSEFGLDGWLDDDTIEVILEGEMPPFSYTVFGLHPEANLADTEVDHFVAGLRNTSGFTEDEDED
ncbi:MAG TPA: heme-binding domain-containing protein [Acidimicrobiales bacterium]|jgi:hypothetical protein|nr:heme-binding domain-containing protein [Acidimicrobiales bacterium]MDP7116783.1 heme-binding domain-containing protein [Acidimicrobiales bacterium]MDP7410762.1 heme-binding domain-containing protein [Acidimicrobiales bacterium]HJL82443.1 heme-binding domain-containing protein [Acidimicrobiales bacterium]|tara:strand:- start:12766 stop:13416 length:651 start_codon:yes stop_codon:yes gene_type:complete